MEDLNMHITQINSWDIQAARYIVPDRDHRKKHSPTRTKPDHL